MEEVSTYLKIETFSIFTPKDKKNRKRKEKGRGSRKILFFYFFYFSNRKEEKIKQASLGSVFFFGEQLVGMNIYRFIGQVLWSRANLNFVINVIFCAHIIINTKFLKIWMS